MKKPFIIRITRPDARSRYSGAILKLPATWTEMQDALERARITNESTNYIIEPVNIGHAFLREHITAVDNLYDLNYLAQCLWELDRIKTNAFEGLVEMESRNQLREPIEATRLLQLIHNLDDCVVIYGIFNNTDLGEFLYENDMLSDEDYALATLKKNNSYYADEYMSELGSQHIDRENGAFTCDGYAEITGDIVDVVLPENAGRPQRPSSPLILRFCKGYFNDLEDDNDIVVRLTCPASEDEIQTAVWRVEAASIKECAWSCFNCLIPAAKKMVDNCGDFDTINTFALALQEMEQQNKLPKYKALLEFTRCDDLGLAVNLAGELDTYALQSEMMCPADYAKEKLEILRATEEGTLMSRHIDLHGFGEALMQHNNAVMTSYGILQRNDCAPLHSQKPEQEIDDLTMTTL